MPPVKPHPQPVIRGVFLILSMLAITLLGNRVAGAGDWPHWRGPNRDDIVAEPSGWRDGQWRLDQQWQTNVGPGSTSPLVVGNHLYVMGWEQGRDHVLCLDAGSGREQWRVSYEAPRYGRQATGDQWAFAGPTSTPEYDPATGFLYTLGVDGDLQCWDTGESGKRVWGINLYERFRVGQRPKVGRAALRDYGYTTAPMVHGDWLLVEAGSDEGNLVALDKRTGARRWSSENRDPAGHTGGLAPIAVQGVPCVALLTLKNLVVVRLDDGHAGQTVAEYPWVTDYANNVASPAVHGNEVLVTSGYNQRAMVKLRITLSGAAEVWKTRLFSKVCTPVIHKGNVYWSWRAIHCLDFQTGQPHWEGGVTGEEGSVVVTADDRLIVLADNGRLHLIEGPDRAPHRYESLAARERLFATEAWPHVVIAGGRLFCKDRAGNLVCLGIR